MPKPCNNTLYFRTYVLKCIHLNTIFKTVNLLLLLIVHQNRWCAVTPLVSHVMERTRRWRERARHGRGRMTRTLPAISRENLCRRAEAGLISARGTRDGW